MQGIRGASPAGHYPRSGVAVAKFLVAEILPAEILPAEILLAEILPAEIFFGLSKLLCLLIQIKNVYSKEQYVLERLNFDCFYA